MADRARVELKLPALQPAFYRRETGRFFPVWGDQQTCFPPSTAWWPSAAEPWRSSPGSLSRIYHRLNEAAMASHHRSVAIREENEALLWKLRFQSRPPWRRLLSGFKRLASP